jgi:hypothetical protein
MWAAGVWAPGLWAPGLWQGLVSGGGGSNIAPTAPGSITVSQVTSTTARVSYTAATDDQGVTGYEYTISLEPHVSVGNVLSFDVSGLAPARGYAVSVRARDAQGNLGPSISAPFSTLGAAVLPPLNLTVIGGSVTGSSFGVTWQVGGNSGATLYRVYLGSASVALVGANSYQFSNLSPGTTYSVYVTAVSGAIESSPSNVISVTTGPQVTDSVLGTVRLNVRGPLSVSERSAATISYVCIGTSTLQPVFPASVRYRVDDDRTLEMVQDWTATEPLAEGRIVIPRAINRTEGVANKTLRVTVEVNAGTDSAATDSWTYLVRDAL